MTLFSLTRCSHLCAVFFFTLMGGTAAAHGVYIYAWPESGHICTQSYYSRASGIAGAEVSMQTPQGEILATKTSSEIGKACFSPPNNSQDLIFVVNAGQGHRGEYPLGRSFVEQALSTKPATNTAEKSTVQAPFAMQQENSTPPSPVQPKQSAAALATAQQRAALSTLVELPPRHNTPATAQPVPPSSTHASDKNIEELRNEVAALRSAFESSEQHTKGGSALAPDNTTQLPRMPDAQSIIAGLALIASLTALGVACHTRKNK